MKRGLSQLFSEGKPMERKHRILLRVLALALVLIILIVVGDLLVNRSIAKAQGFGTDISPYKFATLPNGTELYKGVYQGCVYYVAVTNFRTVSIVPFGPGCK